MFEAQIAPNVETDSATPNEESSSASRSKQNDRADEKFELATSATKCFFKQYKNMKIRLRKRSSTYWTPAQSMDKFRRTIIS